jgi:predicted Zn-dependent protease
MWLISLLVIFSAQALDPVQTAIEHAQGLALKKNRKEACATLQEALTNTPAPAKSSRTKLSEALSQISKVFFTDKGQKAYESGQSMMFDNPDMALVQFRDALTLEDGNIAVLASIAKIQLMKQDCEGARATIEKARLINPVAAEPAVLELRTLVCEKRFEGLREKARQLPALDKWEEQYVQYILAQDALHNETPKKAFEALNKIVEEQPQFPESYLYLARAGSELKKENEPWLQKYISLCKAVTAKERKRYSLEPRLCANMKEAEDELAKKSTDI